MHLNSPFSTLPAMALAAAVSFFAPECAFAEQVNTTAFARSATLSIAPHGGAGDLTEFPVPVRLSPTLFSGFNYSQCLGDGRDICFADADGNLIPHEIDTWDTSGESLVWVRLPSYSATAATTVTMYWTAATPPHSVDASDVWSQYLSVWHMNSNLRDATGFNHLSALNNPLCGSALLGNGMTLTASSKQVLLTNSALGDAGGAVLSTFTITGWLRPGISYSGKNARVFSTKPGSGGYTLPGFEYILSNGRLLLRGDGNSATHNIPTAWADHFAIDQWTHVGAVFNGNSSSAYFDGAFANSGSISKITVARRLGIGNTGEEPSNDNVFAGCIDEIRIRACVSTADWIAAEHFTTDTAGLVTYGAIVSNDTNPIASFSLTGSTPTSASTTRGAGQG